MDEDLEEFREIVRDSEYEELFNEPVEKVKENKDKVKEALWQVHGIVWNKQLYQYCEENSFIKNSKLEELTDSDQQLERIRENMGAITLSGSGDEIEIPCRDVKYALTRKPALWD